MLKDILEVLSFMRENCRDCHFEGIGQKQCTIQKNVIEHRDAPEVREHRCKGWKKEEIE